MGGALLDAFREGGWGMWPVLIFGMVTLGAAARYARRPGIAQLRFIAAMWLTTLVTALHATWTCFAAVMRYLEDPARVPDAEVTRTLFVGLKESTRPGTLAGLLLSLSCMLVAIGLHRAQREEEKRG